MIKIILIFIFYQHIIHYENAEPKINSGYGWNQLVSSMHKGKYEMRMQSGLSDILDLKSKAGRPPIYAMLLFFFTSMGKASSLVAVFFQSVITSLVAYLGYLIVKLATSQEKTAKVCCCVLFLFPMNFLKSGTIDEAPLMLVFLLTALYALFKYIRNQDRFILLILSGALLALSTLTRLTTLPILVGIVVFMILSRKLKSKKLIEIMLFIGAYLLILFPWVYRNCMIYGKPVLTVGSARILLFAQSEEFIRAFPYKSPDAIERDYLRSFYESHKELGSLDTISLDEEFTRYAVSEATNYPEKYFRSLIVKIKVFFPNRYFPKQNNILKDFVFLFSYYSSLILFFWTIIKYRMVNKENIIIIISIIGIIIPGMVFFMLSRHLYPVLILMIIYAFKTYSYVENKKENLAANKLDN